MRPSPPSTPGATTSSSPTAQGGSSGTSNAETALHSRTSMASRGAWTGSTPCWAGSPRDGSVLDSGNQHRPGGCPPAATVRVTAKRRLTRRPDPCRGIVGRRVVPLSRNAPDSGLSRRDPYDVLSRLASRVTSRRDLTLERPNNDRVRDKRSLAPPHVYLGPGRSVESWSPHGGITRCDRPPLQAERPRRAERAGVRPVRVDGPSVVPAAGRPAAAADRPRDETARVARRHDPAGVRRVQGRCAEGLRADHRDPVLADAGGGRPLRAHRGRDRREDRHGPEGRDPPSERGPGEDGRRGRGRGPRRGASVGRRRHPVPGGREGAAADALIQSLLSLPFIRSPRVRPAPAACFFISIGWTRSLSLIPSCRSNFRTRSSPGVIVPDSSFAITLARSLIFAPRSACFHPRDSRAWRIIWGKSSISSNSPACAYTSLGVRRRWRASSRWAMTGGIVLGRNGALDTSSPKRAHSPHPDRTVASNATLLRRATSAPHNSQITNRARKD